VASAYGIKDVFLTLQGEGARAGAKSVFVRMTGCNLWSGNPAHRDRGTGPCARWCDTDFFKGDTIELPTLRDRMEALWPGTGPRWCVITGGEPALQIDDALVSALHEHGWRIAVETNGTIANRALHACDHVCISPKRGTAWRTLGIAHEIKVILPGADGAEQGWTDAELVEIEQLALAAPERPPLFVQPQDPIAAGLVLEQSLLKHTIELAAAERDVLEQRYRANLDRCIQWVLHHEHWRLSAQLHKYVQIA
jgi:organic radical activating enzyme